MEASLRSKDTVAFLWSDLFDRTEGRLSLWMREGDIAR
jgi:hypothetical protein